MKILLTGAHFTPAVALIEELKKMAPQAKLVYVGRKTTLEGDKTQSVESKILPNLGVKFISITAGRLQRAFSPFTILSLLKIPVGFIQAFFILIKEKPSVIVSFGGYVSVPIIVWGWLFSIPIIVHEQTLVSGLANQIGALFANKIAVSFNQKQSFNKKVILTGNPLRAEIIYPIKKISLEYSSIIKAAKENKLPLVLIMGGNQGSHLINEMVEENLDKLKKMACLIHVTGDNSLGDFERLEKFQDENYLVKKWIGKEIGAVLEKIDFAISRAGANTLSELAFFNKPALVIPLQPLYKDEQVVNANYFEKLGLVKVLLQKNLSSQTFLEEVKCMIKNSSKMFPKTEGIVIKDAAKRLALETILLTKV